jgi:hypothetical protein
MKEVLIWALAITFVVLKDGTLLWLGAQYERSKWNKLISKGILRKPKRNVSRQ